MANHRAGVLTLKQQKFCEGIVGGKLHRDAYIHAYDTANLKSSSIDRKATYLIAEPHVKEYIAKLRKNLADKSTITHHMLTEELRKMAFFDVRKLYDNDGMLKEINNIDDICASAVCGFEISKIGEHTQIIKVKLNDKLTAIDKLARHLGYYERDNKVTIQGSIVTMLPTKDPDN